MSTELNDKILKAINKHSNVIDAAKNCAVDDFSYEDLANDIEALVLQSKIDLLKELQFYSYTIEIEGGGNEVISPSSVESKISELSNQLKELSKTD